VQGRQVQEHQQGQQVLFPEFASSAEIMYREKVSFIHNATHAKGTYKIKTLGSRLGSLY
jgi:hypothetical protein